MRAVSPRGRIAARASETPPGPGHPLGLARWPIFLWVPVLLLAVPTAQSGLPGGDHGEIVLQRSLVSTPGRELHIDVPDADVEILDSESDEIEVTVYLDARNIERARERYEEMDLRVEHRDGDVRISTESRRGRGWQWSWSFRSESRFQLTIQVRLPHPMDAEISTSDGDIYLESLEGDAFLETSDGDIRVQDLTGEAELHTSDGDIDIREMQGDRLDAQTSDGRIYLAGIRCPEIHVRTSDGPIEGQEIESQEVILRTSDGDIDLRGVAGALIAASGDGDISAEITRFAGARLETSEGDIWIACSEDAPADLDLEAERVRISETQRFTGRTRRDRVRGPLNGGGASLEAISDEGEIVLRLREAR